MAQLATCVLADLLVCISIAFAHLLFHHDDRLSATASVNAPVPFGIQAASTFVAPLVAVSETTGTVAFGAEVLTASVKLVSDPDAALSVVPVNDKLVPSVISSIAPVAAVHLPSNLFVACVRPDVVTAPAFTILVPSIATTPADTRVSVVSLA